MWGLVMKLKNKIKIRLDELSNDTAGSIVITWALSMMAVIFAVGATYDMSQITKAKQHAQMMADSMALTASISVDMDNEKRFQENKRYSYIELGHANFDFTKSMKGYVVYDIVDNQDPKNEDKPEWDRSRLLARSTIEGKYKPAFMGVLGYDNIKFVATADVAYAAKKGTPASVFFAVDNSGSMGNRDSQGKVKITTLKSSLNGFMTTLGGVERDGRKLFRTALYPY